jgi:hypothetical protein
VDDFNSRQNGNGGQKPPVSGFIKNLNPLVYVLFVLFVVFFLYQIIGGTIAVLSLGDSVTGEDSLDVQLSRIILAFAQFMFILAPVIFFTRLQTPDLKDTFRLYLPKVHLLVLSILGIIFIQPFLQGYLFFQDRLIDNLPLFKDQIKQVKDVFDLVEKTTLKILTAYSVLEFVVVVLVIAVTPAICEEILFRGFVLKNIGKIARPSMAIFLSGFMFAVYHFQPFNVIPLIILGWFLGFVVYYSNSIYTGIVCHFLNNFFASYFLFVYGKDEFKTPEVSGSELPDTIIMTVFSIILFAALVFLFYKFRFREEAAEA